MNGERLEVLVVDDERSVADSLVQILNLFGYSAASSYDPAHALEWLASHPCDIVISDVVFDGRSSGIDLAIQLKTLHPNCRVMLISGNNSTADLLKGAVAGGHSFDILPKPVHPSVILERLKSPLE